MGDQPRACVSGLLQRQLDAQPFALGAVIEQGNRPRQLGSFRVIRGVVVEAVVRKLFHASS